MAQRSANIIASTLGMDAAEIGDYRYHFGRTKQPVFAIGDRYYIVSKRKPKGDDEGLVWRQASDQFFAKQSNTTLWVAKVLDDAEPKQEETPEETKVRETIHAAMLAFWLVVKLAYPNLHPRSISDGAVQHFDLAATEAVGEYIDRNA